MKKLLLSLAVLLPLSVWAQEYHPLLKDGKEWRERADHIVFTYSYDEEGNPKGLDVNNYAEYYAYSIMGDTLINGKNFKKLYLCAEDTSYYCAMYEDGATTIESTNGVTITRDFEVKEGAKFEIKISN